MKPLCCLIIVILTTLSSCKKTADVVIETPKINNEKVIEQFLTIPENSSSLVKEITADLRKREFEKPFIVDFVQRNGFPVWNKIIGTPMQSANNELQANSITSNQKNGIAFIPLVDTTTKEVKSFMFCTKIKDSVFGYNTYNKSTILNDENIFPLKKQLNSLTLSVIAFFENQINGKTSIQYAGKDQLYKISKSKISFKFNETSSEANITSNSNNNPSKNVNFTICLEYLGSIIQEYYAEDGNLHTIEYRYFGPCGMGNGGGSLPGVTVHTKIRSSSNSGIFSSNWSSGFLPSPNNPLYGTIAWAFGYAPTNNIPYTHHNGSTFGPFLENPNHPYWGTPIEPLNVQRANWLIAHLDFGGDPNITDLLYNNENVVQFLETSLQRSGYSSQYAAASSTIVNALAANKISLADANELMDALLEAGYSEETMAALDITIEAISSGIAHTEVIPPGFFNTIISPRLSSSLINPIGIMLSQYFNQFQLKYASLKLENAKLPVSQQKSNTKLFFFATAGIWHTSLDLLGLIPVGGEVFDILNGFTYILEGDNTNAYLSWAAAVPIAGYAATGVKAIKAGAVIIATKNASGFYRVNRVASSFTKMTGAGIGQVGHHIISFHAIVQEHDLFQLAIRAGFNPNDAIQNGKAIASHLNSGNHGIYANKLVTAMNKITSDFPNLNPIQAKEKLMELIHQIKTTIDNSSGVHMDYLNF